MAPSSKTPCPLASTLSERQATSSSGLNAVCHRPFIRAAEAAAAAHDEPSAEAAHAPDRQPWTGEEPPGPPRSLWRRMPSFLGLSVASVGALALLGTCLYRRLRHPEWTERKRWGHFGHSISPAPFRSAAAGSAATAKAKDQAGPGTTLTGGPPDGSIAGLSRV